jgi:hypothetical protein
MDIGLPVDISLTGFVCTIVLAIGAVRLYGDAGLIGGKAQLQDSTTGQFRLSINNLKSFTIN